MTNTLQTKSQAVIDVCAALSKGQRQEAVDILRERYAFAPPVPLRHNAGPVQSTRVFLRDGFIDRYTGDRLMFPPVLRLVAIDLPTHFPYHPNWKSDVTHRAFWELSATVDHFNPRSLGGTATDDNLLTTSLLRNMAKGNWSCEELGWTLCPPGTLSDWDGQVAWFRARIEADRQLLKIEMLRKWYRAVQSLWPAV